MQFKIFDAGAWSYGMSSALILLNGRPVAPLATYSDSYISTSKIIFEDVLLDSEEGIYENFQSDFSIELDFLKFDLDAPTFGTKIPITPPSSIYDDISIDSDSDSVSVQYYNPSIGGGTWWEIDSSNSIGSWNIIADTVDVHLFKSPDDLASILDTDTDLDGLVIINITGCKARLIIIR